MTAFVQKTLAVSIFLLSIIGGVQLASKAIGQTDSSAQPTPAPQSETSTEAQASPEPTPKETAFVPSEVESYAPIPVKVDDPRMVLKTSMGTITIRLYPAIAPQNVRNVIELARGEREFIDAHTSKRARRPYYTNLTFHRVVPGFLIQTGCPFGNGRGGPGYYVADEFHPSARFNEAGIVAMAPQRDGAKMRKDANGSQFFITLGPMPDADDKFTIIGRVERGMDVVRRISQVKTGPTDRPIRRVFLNSVEIIDRSGLYDESPKKKAN